jgi:hypothetical protein
MGNLYGRPAGDLLAGCGSIRQKTCEGCVMKNPLDSLGQTIILGFVLTVIVAVLIPLFGA